jgi:hypothetical protein
VSNQHKRPILAFVLLAVVAAVVVGIQLRANAGAMALIEVKPISVHGLSVSGSVPPHPAQRTPGP